jgi:hypothetical protein
LAAEKTQREGQLSMEFRTIDAAGPPVTQAFFDPFSDRVCNFGEVSGATYEQASEVLNLPN